MTGPFATLSALVEEGGFVIPPLLGVGLVLFYALGERVYLLRRGSLADVSALFAVHLQGNGRAPGTLLGQAAARAAQECRRGRADTLRSRLEVALAEVAEGARKRAILIRALVTVAPLLGLLGTVSGMIETFQSLGDMALYSQSGGVAGGVSEALLSTQVGLVVAVPGLLLGRALDRKERSLLLELERLKDLALAARGGAA